MEHSRKDDNEIVELKELLREHIQGEEKTVHEILNEIKEMREQLTPLVEIYTNSIGAYKTVTFFLKLAAMVGAAVGAILLLKKI